MRKLILICVGVMCMFSLHAQDKVQADSAYAAEKYEEAIPILSASCSNYPTYLGYIELGKSFEKTGKYQEAETYWTWASWMVPHKFTPLYLQMQMNLSTGKLNNAYHLSDSILHKEIKLYSPGLNKILREAKQVKSIKQK